MHPGVRPLVGSAVLAMLAACSACRRTTGGAADAGVEGGTTPASASSTAGKLSGASSPEAAWVEARSGDPLELARLANVEGVHKLAEVAASDTATDEDRATAIRAIAFVLDPSPAAETLTKLVTDPSPASVERSTLALQTLAAITSKRAPIEELEPGAWRACGEGLLVALKTLEGPMRRELAIRALLGLADRGAVPRSAVPAQ